MKSLVFIFILISSSALSQSLDTVSLLSKHSDGTYKELSLTEWKRFKDFEQKMAKSSQKEGGLQLRGYVRDSIQILGVKLMAVKLLDEKSLLDKDISENPTYYITLLEKLRESAIPQAEYLFLEEKIAYLGQAELQNQLGHSRWLNIALIALCLALIYAVVHLKKKVRKSTAPELSRQEVTVRNLILQGKSNKEIANELFISLSTVKSHITNLYGKLNVANRRELFQKSTGAST
ncbi:MAG: LuxR C-terminal-related transcriptional regulator [Bacteroidota bacterium]